MQHACKLKQPAPELLLPPLSARAKELMKLENKNSLSSSEKDELADLYHERIKIYEKSQIDYAPNMISILSYRIKELAA